MAQELELFKIRSYLMPYMKSFNIDKINDYLKNIYYDTKAEDHAGEGIVNFFLQHQDCNILNELDDTSFDIIGGTEHTQEIEAPLTTSINNSKAVYMWPVKGVKTKNVEELILPKFIGKESFGKPSEQYHTLLNQKSTILKTIDIRSMKYFMARDMKPILPVDPECINKETAIYLKKGKAKPFKAMLQFALADCLGLYTTDEAKRLVNNFNIIEVDDEVKSEETATQSESTITNEYAEKIRSLTE